MNISRLYFLIHFPLLIVLIVLNNKVLAHELCGSTDHFKIPSNGMFQIPGVKPAIMIKSVTESIDHIKVDPKSIDDIMCFSKLNLPEKSCLSIQLTMRNNDDHNLIFTGVFHSMIDNIYSNKATITPPGFKSWFQVFCSVCKTALEKDDPHFTVLRPVTPENEAPIDHCGTLVGGARSYEVNFNAQTQGLGLNRVAGGF